jgi:hypothetical protein
MVHYVQCQYAMVSMSKKWTCLEPRCVEGESSTFNTTYVDEFTRCCQISTTLGRCTWPRDLRVLHPPPLPRRFDCCTCPLPKILLVFTIDMFYIWKCNFFLSFAAPCVNIWGSPETGSDAPPCWGPESHWTCRKILKLSECVCLSWRCVKINKFGLLGGIQEVVYCKRLQISWKSTDK